MDADRVVHLATGEAIATVGGASGGLIQQYVRKA
jgi:hypothetical protein